MYEKIGITMKMAMAIAFFINAAWWLLVTIPLLRKYEQKLLRRNAEASGAGQL